MKMIERAVTLCACAILVACNAGAPQNALPPAAAGAGRIASSPPAQSLHGRKGSLVVSVRIPRRRHRGLHARYISAATKGMTLAIVGPTNLTQAINLTPSDQRCTGIPLTCTIAIPLVTGSYGATVTTYDQAPVNGTIPAGANELSLAHNISFSVTSGKANTFNVTLDGVPSSIVVGGFPGALLGTAFSSPQAFSVTVKDADGFTIVGTYGTPVTLTDGDQSGVTAIATSGSDHPQPGQLLSSADTATITYTGKPVAPVTISAAAGSANGSGIFSASLPIYVSDTTNNQVKVLGANCALDSCAATIGSGFSHPTGLAVDGSGNVFVGDFLNNAVDEIKAIDGSVVTLGSGFSNPAGIALDAAGDVFVADTGNNRIKEMLAVNGVVPASPTIVTIGFGMNTPFGVAVDSSGDVFVADTGNNAVKEVEAVNGVIPASPTILNLGSGFSGPGSLVVDSAGDVIVDDIGHGAVKEIPAGNGSVITLDGSFSEPWGIAMDGSGNVYVTDDLQGTVTELAAVNGTLPASPVVTTVASGFNVPTGITVPR
jgi:NHL repeat